MLFFARGFNSVLSLQRLSFSSAANRVRHLSHLIAGGSLDTVRTSWLLEFDCTESTCKSNFEIEFEIAWTNEASFVLAKFESKLGHY